MKIAMAQMQMSDDINHNLETSLKYCDRAKDSDLLFSQKSNCPHFFRSTKKEMLQNIV